MEEIYELQTDYSSSLSAPPPLPGSQNIYFSSYYNYNPLTTSSFRDRGGPLSDGSSEPSLLFASSCAAVSTDSGEEVSTAMIKAKISSHPLYPKLLQSYIDCQKVVAPPDMMQVLDEIWREKGGFSGSRCGGGVSCCLDDDADPELDDFMETYCKVLDKFKADLGKPLEEASKFLASMETQLTNLLCNSSASSATHLSSEVSSEEEISGSESTEILDFQQQNNENVDHLKNKLMRKYSGYLTSLKQEFSKKKKKGKLPKEATQILLDWWNIHYKWPYPTESDKIALVESTGLDQKQINNWFINQRKRHWKPSENMSFAVVDSLYGPLFTSN